MHREREHMRQLLLHSTAQALGVPTGTTPALEEVLMLRAQIEDLKKMLTLRTTVQRDDRNRSKTVYDMSSPRRSTSRDDRSSAPPPPPPPIPTSTSPTPAASSPSSHVRSSSSSSLTRQRMITTLCFLAYYTCSISLVLFNRWLFSSEANGGLALPFPIMVTAAHLATNAVLAIVVIALLKLEPPLQAIGYLGKGTAFPYRTIARGVMPVSVFMGIDIALSNMAFIYLDSTFVEMVKQSAVLYTLVLTIATGLRAFTRTLVASVVVILVGQILITSNEARFDMKGFVIVSIAACAASTKNIFIELLVAKPSAPVKPDTPRQQQAQDCEELAILTTTTATATTSSATTLASSPSTTANPHPHPHPKKRVGVMQALALFMPAACAMLILASFVPYKECKRLCSDYPALCVRFPDPLGAKARLAHHRLMETSHSRRKEHHHSLRGTDASAWTHVCAASLPAANGAGSTRMLSEVQLVWMMTDARMLEHLVAATFTGALFAFMLHVFEVTVIGRASSMTAAVMNVAKMAVFFASAQAAFGETLELLQGFGFVVTCCGLFLYVRYC
ncbi:triose-phosphate transporter [Pycnococcus provasolii]